MRRLWVALLTAAPLALGVGVAASRAETPCEQLKSVSLPHAVVTDAVLTTAGSIQACKIEVASHPTADSDIRIEVWIPQGAAWNGAFVQVGNGGFAGRIYSEALAPVAGRGFAVAGTDDGHQAGGTDGRWAVGHPEKIVDFGWRALKETTDASKALIAAYKGGAPAHAYFQGCSDGGREALMEAERFPNDFDGIVAGAPANNFTGLLGLAAFTQQALAAPGAWFGPDKLALLQASALATCGGGTYIADPMACRFDPKTLICKDGQDPAGCLTAAQAGAAAAIYGGMRDPKTGRRLYVGYTPGGEAQPGGWAPWITGTAPDRIDQAAGRQFATGFFRDMYLQGEAFNISTFDLYGTFEKAKAKYSSILDSADPDLGKFRAHGGKLIQYHGWNDPAIPARGSILYYETVRRTLGDTKDFYKLYLVPGMLHCAGGAGPGNVDWLGQIQAWVEHGKAPELLIATRGAPTQTPAPETPHQTLCPYPLRGDNAKGCLAPTPRSGS